MNTTITTPTDKPQKLPQLVKGQSIYKLIVPQDVEEKIRYLIRKFPSTEWSGVLFITHQGSFENNDLVITCKDIFPMDLGSAGWTEFRMSEDVAAYMAQNIELFDCEIGLLHSHHQLGAYFSGQDNAMLQQEGNDTNCFVSLVVDTRGTYVARITRKVQSKSEVTIKSLGTSYEFFGEGSKTIVKDDSEVTKTVDKEYIEYFDLQVERHEAPNSLAWLDSRFDEIAKKKASQQTAYSAVGTKPYVSGSPINLGSAPSQYSPQSEHSDKGFFDWLHNEGNNINGQAVSNVPPANVNAPVEGELNFNWTPDSKKIHEAAVHMVTLNLILNPKDFNFKHWISRHMANVYRKVFGGFSLDDGTPTAFTEWRDFIIQFTLDYFDVPDIPDALLDDQDQFMGIVAQAIIDELSEYVNLNPYIQEYINALYQYIV